MLLLTVILTAHLLQESVQHNRVGACALSLASRPVGNLPQALRVLFKAGLSLLRFQAGGLLVVLHLLLPLAHNLGRK